MIIKILKKLQSIYTYARISINTFSSYLLYNKVKRLGVILSKNVSFHGAPIISMATKSTIRIGDNSVLCSASEMTSLGVNHPVVLRTLIQGAVITIGKNTGISGCSICAAKSISIGDNCLLGANVIISDTDFHAIKSLGRRDNNNLTDIASSSIIIEDNVFVGTGTIILKGIFIGKNSVIGAGSVVTNNVPANTVFAGNPAKFIRYLDD